VTKLKQQSIQQLEAEACLPLSNLQQKWDLTQGKLYTHPFLGMILFQSYWGFIMKAKFHRLAGLLFSLLAVLLGLATPGAGSAATSNAIIQQVVIGSSVSGRNIVAYEKGNPNATRKVLVICTQHGNEQNGTIICRHIVNHVAVSLAADVWIIPRMNPDGYAAHRRTNDNGVDLNRNFPTTDWQESGFGTNQYSGPSPASEPETRAMMDFLGQLQPRFATSVHQSLNGIGNAKDPEFVQRLSNQLNLPIGFSTSASNSLQSQRTCTSSIRGTMNAWYNPNFRGVMVTVELPKNPSLNYLHKAAVGILKASFAR
jgi:murein peptide amidase A